MGCRGCESKRAKFRRKVMEEKKKVIKSREQILTDRLLGRRIKCEHNVYPQSYCKICDDPNYVAVDVVVVVEEPKEE